MVYLLSMIRIKENEMEENKEIKQPKKKTKEFSNFQMMIKHPIRTFMFVLVMLFAIGKLYDLVVPQDVKDKAQTVVNHSSLSVDYLEETQESVFLNVGIQHIETQKKNAKIPWTNIGVPFSEKKAIIILNYNSKLGIKQTVSIDKVTDKKYQITVPKFEVIGFELDEKEPYVIYDSSGDILSVATEDIDTGQIVSNALNEKVMSNYLNKYQKQLKASAEEYYTSIFKVMDKDIQLEFKYL